MSVMVRVYDFNTRGVTQIPARELADFMVAAKVEGIEGTVWVDARDTKSTPGYRHDPFDEDISDFLLEIKTALDDVYPMSLKKWEDGFRCDTNPEKEIAMWLHLSHVYKELTSGRNFDEQQRKDYFRILLGCLNNPREHVLKAYSPAAISIEEANRIMARMYGDK